MYKVNLLPEYLQSRSYKVTGCNLLLWGSGVVLFLLLLCYGIFYYQFISDQKQLARAQEELAQLRPKMVEIQNLTAVNKARQAKYQTLSHILKNRLSWHPLLQDLPLALPMDTWINRIEIQKTDRVPGSGGFVSSGYKQSTARQAGEPPKEKAESAGGLPENVPQSPPVPNRIYFYGTCWTMGSVGILVDHLSRLPYFETVNLVEAEHDREKGFIKFELAATVKGGEWDVRDIAKSQP